MQSDFKVENFPVTVYAVNCNSQDIEESKVIPVVLTGIVERGVNAGSFYTDGYGILATSDLWHYDLYKSASKANKALMKFLENEASEEEKVFLASKERFTKIKDKIIALR